MAERPIFHHLEHCVESHISLCVLDDHWMVAMETTLGNRGVDTSWSTIRESLAS